MSKLICPKCGAENSDQSTHCFECEASLAAVAPSDINNFNPSEVEEFDLMQESENDLPGLLSALKQNGDIDAIDDEADGAVEQSPAISQENSLPEQPGQEEQVPDWLNRIRQRASEEEDSVGEITQKISAAQKSLEDDKKAHQHQNFKSWLQNVRGLPPGQAGNPPPQQEDLGDKDAQSPEHDPDWLLRIRKVKGTDPEDEATEPVSISDQGGDSLLQWLVALEEGDEDSQDQLEDTSALELEDDQKTRQTRIVDRDQGSEVTRQVRTTQQTSSRVKPPELHVSREEQNQADQLSAVIGDERAPRPPREPEGKSSAWVIRLVVAVLLITGLSLSLFLGSGGGVPQGALQPHNVAALSWAEELEARSSLLLVFDYQSGFAEEISLVARPILQAVIQSESELSILSSTASGVVLSRQLLGDMAGADGLDIIDLGYFPVSVYGAFSMANRAIPQWRFKNLPELPNLVSGEGFDGALILSDRHDRARVWVEQLNALSPQMPIKLLVTSQAGPMLMPYWEAGQVTGMIAGITEAAGIEALQEDSSVIGNRWQAYRTGSIMLIVVMLIGAVFLVDQNPEDQEMESA